MNIYKVTNKNGFNIIYRIIEENIQFFDGVMFINMDEYIESIKSKYKEEYEDINNILNAIDDMSYGIISKDIEELSNRFETYDLKVEEYEITNISGQRYEDIKIHKIIDGEKYCTVICCVDSIDESIMWYDGLNYNENFEIAVKRDFIDKEYQLIYNDFINDIEELDILLYTAGLQMDEELALDEGIMIERF